MNAFSTTLARIASVAVVLILAAAVGLIAGNWMRAADAELSAGAGVPTVAYPTYQQIENAAGLGGTPTYADPHRQIMEAAEDAAATVPSVAYPTFQQIEAASAEDGFTQTWGNLDERSARDAAAADADGSQKASPRLPLGPSPR